MRIGTEELRRRRGGLTQPDLGAAIGAAPTVRGVIRRLFKNLAVLDADGRAGGVGAARARRLRTVCAGVFDAAEVAEMRAEIDAVFDAVAARARAATTRTSSATRCSTAAPRARPR